MTSVGCQYRSGKITINPAATANAGSILALNQSCGHSGRLDWGRGDERRFRPSITNNFPRIAPRFDQFAPAGRSGWFKLYSVDDQAILGEE